ncbi:MAG: alpha-L-rhamnosidase N-terminal domain-containing protein [Clostridia bacterium]|nr:alpha-L-rhamnosidase N-terminal domain-containing protein [Clostridia bacterium]
MAFSNEAVWIQCPDFESPKFLKTFDISSEITEAKLTICGLGFFDVRINGQKITQDLLVPSWSDYEPRRDRRLLYPLNDSHTYRIYYLEYDVTKFLNISENRIEITLGNGWYNQRCRNIEGDLWYDTPRLCFDIDIDGFGHIVSDESVMVSESRFVFNNVYIGEQQDFRIKDNFTKTAKRARIPEGIMQKQECPADRVHRIIYPKLVAEYEQKAIYDIGENTTGWAVFTQNATAVPLTIIRCLGLV